jgi:hypothetical protein
MSRAIAALLLTALAATTARAQTISPGPLARPHEKLEGVTRCTSCHEIGKGVTDARCLACHGEIAARLDRGRGYHATLRARSAGACASCHRDHVGRDFPLVEWPGGAKEAFPHVDTGFALEGAHARLDCAKCHEPGKVRDEAVRARKGAAAALERTMLGLDPACASCHPDPHQGALGADCRSCHDAAAWRPAPGFDHGKTDFPLRGAHKAIACATCHGAAAAAPAAPGTAAARAFRGVRHDTCTACHEDRHGGALGKNCTACHSEQSWKPATFDPARHAKLPLTGAHAKAQCTSCHGPRLERPLAGAACASCHEDVRHRGSLGSRCENCHGVEAFARPTYDPAGHAAGRFPLVGRHAAARCESCHLEEKAARPTSQAAASRPATLCASCHAAPHEAAALRVDCARCHTAAAWGPVASFDAAAHRATRYPLEGAHAALDCVRCHGLRPGGAKGGPILAKTSGLSFARCTDCHADAHRGELARRPDGGSCESCHDTRGFRPARFDRAEHAKTSFPLAGAHAAIACATCHALRPSERAAALAAKAAPLRLSPRGDTCRACHADPHRGQFGRTGDRSDCSACHDTAAFAPARSFDHAKTTFPLDGKHEAAACTACHLPPPPGGTRALSAACAACHRDVHLGQFTRRPDGRSQGCAECHATDTFRGAARFDHAKTRFPLDGKHAGLECARCHRPVSLAPGLATPAYRSLPLTCAGCHVDQHPAAPWREEAKKP